MVLKYDQETANRILKLKKKNLSWNEIAEIFKSEGYKRKKGGDISGMDVNGIVSYWRKKNPKVQIKPRAYVHKNQVTHQKIELPDVTVSSDKIVVLITTSKQLKEVLGSL